MSSDSLDELYELALALDAGVPKYRRMPKHIEVPLVSNKRHLSTDDQWRSLLWCVDTAQEHGKGGLRGVALALARIIQAKALEAHLFDVRDPVRDGISEKELLWDTDVALTTDGATLDTLPRRMRRGKALNMAETVVLPQTWMRIRLLKALSNIGEGLPHGSWQQDHRNHFGVEWRPWPLLWVSNGNHSTMAGLVRRGGSFKPAETYDLRPVLQAVNTDGRTWYRADTGAAIGAVNSMPMAGIWVVGQRLIGLRKAGHPA